MPHRSIFTGLGRGNKPPLPPSRPRKSPAVLLGIALVLTTVSHPGAVQAQPVRPAVPAPVKVPVRKVPPRIAAAAVPVSLREQELGIMNLRSAEPLLRNYYFKVTQKPPESASSYLHWLFDWQYQDRGRFPMGIKGVVLHWTAGRHVFGALDALKSRNNSVHFIITEEMPAAGGETDCLVIKLMSMDHIPRAAAFPDISTFTFGGHQYEKYDGAYIDIEVTATGFDDIVTRPKQYRRLLQLLDYLADHLSLWETIESADPTLPEDFERITQVLTGHGVIAQEYIATMLKIKRPDLADYPRSDFTPAQVRRVVADLQDYRRTRDSLEEESQCSWDFAVRSRSQPDGVAFVNGR